MIQHHLTTQHGQKPPDLTAAALASKGRCEGGRSRRQQRRIAVADEDNGDAAA